MYRSRSGIVGYTGYTPNYKNGPSEPDEAKYYRNIPGYNGYVANVKAENFFGQN